MVEAEARERTSGYLCLCGGDHAGGHRQEKRHHDDRFCLGSPKTGRQAPLEAIYTGALIRFRPIMMTAMAALMGSLPIALGLGAGAESRRPPGLAVVGGLLVSQLLTLYITPVFNLYMELFKQKVSGLFRKKPRL